MSFAPECRPTGPSGSRPGFAALEVKGGPDLAALALEVEDQLHGLVGLVLPDDLGPERHPLGLLTRVLGGRWRLGNESVGQVRVSRPAEAAERWGQPRALSPVPAPAGSRRPPVWPGRLVGPRARRCAWPGRPGPRSI